MASALIYPFCNQTAPAVLFELYQKDMYIFILKIPIRLAQTLI